MDWKNITLMIIPWVILGSFLFYVILTQKNWKEKLLSIVGKVIEYSKDGNLTIDEIIEIIKWAMANNADDGAIKNAIKTKHIRWGG